MAKVNLSECFVGEDLLPSLLTTVVGRIQFLDGCQTKGPSSCLAVCWGSLPFLPDGPHHRATAFP